MWCSAANTLPGPGNNARRCAFLGQTQVVHLAIANGRFTFKYGCCPLVVMDASNRSAGASDYTASLNLKVKVLDFVKSGGPSGIRTLDTRIKSPVLFRAELTAQPLCITQGYATSTVATLIVSTNKNLCNAYDTTDLDEKILMGYPPQFMGIILVHPMPQMLLTPTETSDYNQACNSS